MAAPAGAAEPMFAANEAVFELAATTTVPGTVIAASELVISTVDPPAGAGPFKVTVHVSVPGATTELCAQEIPDSSIEAVGTGSILIAVEAPAPFADAVRMTLPADAAEETLTVKLALSAFPGIVADAGNKIAVLLLESCTPRPPLGAGALNATVHESEAGLAITDSLQDNAVGTGGSEESTCDPHPFIPVRLPASRKIELSRIITDHILDCLTVGNLLIPAESLGEYGLRRLDSNFA